MIRVWHGRHIVEPVILRILTTVSSWYIRATEYCSIYALPNMRGKLRARAPGEVVSASVPSVPIANVGSGPSSR